VLRLSVLDEPLTLQVNMPVVDIIHPQNNKFVIGVKTKATGDSQINDSLE